MPDPPPVLATFVARDNRFVLRAALADGTDVRAYLPNTARLADVLVPGATLVLHPATDPARRTRWSATRVWDGAWVSLEAAAASALVAEHLEAGGVLPGWPPARAVRREVPHAGHRFDLEVALDDGRTAIAEVKSLSRARSGVAPLSDTPSTRGTAHLETLAGLATPACPTAVVFVVQRGDAAVEADHPTLLQGSSPPPSTPSRPSPGAARGSGWCSPRRSSSSISASSPRWRMPGRCSAAWSRPG